MTPFDNQFSSSSCNLCETYSSSSVYLYPYARYAFLELLSKLSIKTIYLPSFICRDMLSPLNELKIQYFFYEVDENLQPLLKDLKCDVIMSINYFGFATDVNSFIKYKEKFNAIFIEDNAHGFLSKDNQGKLLGTRGDFGLLSLRKTISLPNGAALLVNNKKYLNVSFETKESKYTYEDERYQKKVFLKKFFISKYIGISFVLLRRFTRFLKTGSSIPLPDAESEKELPSNYFTTTQLISNTLNINSDRESKRRRKMYEEVQKWAVQFDIKPIFELDEGSVPFEFAFIDNGNFQKFERYLYLKGFFVLPWPDLPDEVVSSSPKFYKNIKVVPFLW